MPTYAYVLSLTFKKEDRPEARVFGKIETGQVTCENFQAAVETVLSTEAVAWDEKRARREIISITRVSV